MTADPTPALRLGLVDDHPAILRAALTEIEAALPVADAVTVRSLADLLATPGPYDVVLLDLQLGDGSQAESNVATLVARGWPVLLYTQESNAAVIGRCLRAGASGIVGKAEELDLLVDAVATVAGGEPYLSGDWASALEAEVASIPNLAPREEEALRLYAAGLPLKSVARRMGVAQETAKDYLMRVRRKYLEVGRPASTKTELYVRAIEDGLLPPPG